VDGLNVLPWAVAVQSVPTVEQLDYSDMIDSSLFGGYRFALTAYTQRAFLSKAQFLKHLLSNIKSD
jgi:hypothetical protein